MFILIAPTVSAESYIATRQELWFSDSSYYKTSHHIKIGKSINMNNYKVFGEFGFGEDINEGTPVGSGASYDYLRFGFTKTFFDTFAFKCKLSKQNEVCWQGSQLDCHQYEV